MSGSNKTHCRMEKWTSRVAHNHQIPGSNPGPATRSIGRASSSRPSGGAAGVASGFTGGSMPFRPCSRIKARRRVWPVARKGKSDD